MTRRYSFLLFGALVAALGLLVPGTARAQVVQDVTDTITAVMLAQTGTPAAFDKLKVTWTFERETAALPDSTDMFRVSWGRSAFSDEGSLGTAINSMNVAVPASGTAGTYTIMGLSAGTEYFVAVTRIRTTTATQAVTVGTPAIPDAGQATAAAPLPAPPTSVMVKGGDKMLTVSWEATTFAGGSGATITGYMVRKQVVKLGAAPGPWLPDANGKEFAMSPAVFPGLTNGVMYNVQVRAVNSAKGMSIWTDGVTGTVGMMDGDDGDDGDDMDDDDDDDMMATPALPLFGILALFAGLLAAGRARLRR